MTVNDSWTDQDFSRLHIALNGYEYTIDIEDVNMVEFSAFLRDKKDILVRLLENPVLLEHESFSVLLMAIFHLVDEFSHRSAVTDLPDSDGAHIAGDMKRVYGLLVEQWLNYMKYLKDNYPYLFSLAVRTNPFDKQASPIVR